MTKVINCDLFYIKSSTVHCEATLLQQSQSQILKISPALRTCMQPIYYFSTCSYLNFCSLCRDFSNNNLAMIEPGSFDNAVLLRDLYVIHRICIACTHDCKSSMYNVMLNVTGILLEICYQTSQMICLRTVPLTLCKNTRSTNLGLVIQLPCFYIQGFKWEQNSKYFFSNLHWYTGLLNNVRL